MKKINVIVNENPALGCDAEKHFNDHFDDTMYTVNGWEIEVKFTYKRDRNDSLKVITPNGDEREIYAYNIPKLHTLLQQLCGINVR